MQTFAKLALAAGAWALGLGAVAPVQAADMGYPEAQAAPGYPAPPPGYYAPPPASRATTAASAARRVWLSAAAARRIRHLCRAALRRGAGTVLRAGAVLARLRASLCLWLWALARLSALVKSTRRVGKGAKRRAHVFLAASSAWASLRSAHPTKKFRRFRNLSRVCESLQLSVRFFVRPNESRARFTANISRQTIWISEAWKAARINSPIALDLHLRHD